MRRRHPDTDRPLINARLAILLEPMTLLGSVLGVMLNVIFPAYLITVFLVVLLSAAAFLTLRKGVALWRTESAARQMGLSLQTRNTEDVTAEDQREITSKLLDDNPVPDATPERAPWGLIASLALLWAVVMMLLLFKLRFGACAVPSSFLSPSSSSSQGVPF